MTDGARAWRRWGLSSAVCRSARAAKRAWAARKITPVNQIAALAAVLTKNKMLNVVDHEAYGECLYEGHAVRP